MHRSKTVLEIHNLAFGHTKSRPLFDGFSMTLSGPERAAITGPNGSGKSTLISLILGQRRPWWGQVDLKIKNFAYLDQKTASLDPDQSVMRNFRCRNPSMTSARMFQILAFFLFRKELLEQKVSTLSGGERVRLLLACILMSEEPPQLLILDEPTNHLDLDSIKCIEEALDQYEGAILVVSHDDRFLERIGVGRTIGL